MTARVCLYVLVGVLAFGVCAWTVPITLTDPFGPNSTVTIDPYTQAGMYSWVVDVSNQIAQSAFWYRIGGAGVATPISSIGTPTINQFTSSDATVTYDGASFSVQVTYSLLGSNVGSGTSDVSESVVVSNKTSSALAFHLFEYMNFDLNGTPANETATHTDSAHIVQTEAATLGQLGVNPAANHWEIGDASTLLNKVNAVSFLNLADSSSPYTGDAAFAFQWDWSVTAHGSQSMSQDSLIENAKVPEPGSAIVLLSAIGLLPLLRRSRR